MLVLAMAAALTGCTVGSEYLRPDLPAPESFAGAQAGALGATCEVVLAPAVDLQFWRGLGDPMLSQLIDAALESSHDLRIALTNYDRANALLRGARFDRYPTMTAGGSAANVRASAAEGRLHAATACIGIATADLFRHFTLAALGVDWSFLDVGRVRARIAAADANAAAALASYEKTVLVALKDTENALVRLAKARVEDRHLESAALDSATAARLPRLRFEAGAVNLHDVLDAERTRLVVQDAFADARTRSATAAVALYRALAGGYGT